MLPSIDKHEQLTAHLATNPTQSKLRPQQKTRVWSQKHQLLSISSPQILESTKSKKMFKLRFLFKDETGKKRSHVVYFGQNSDFIFTGDKQARMKKILKMKNIDNPFHPDYWSAHLANKYPTMKEGLQKFTQFFISANNAKMLKKVANQMPKQLK